MQLATLKIYVHHAVLNARRTQMLLLKGLGMATKQSPYLRP